MLIELFTVLTAPVLVLFNDLLSAVGARQIQYFVVVEDHLDESADLIEASRGFRHVVAPNVPGWEGSLPVLLLVIRQLRDKFLGKLKIIRSFSHDHAVGAVCGARNPA